MVKKQQFIETITIVVVFTVPLYSLHVLTFEVHVHVDVCMQIIHISDQQINNNIKYVMTKSRGIIAKPQHDTNTIPLRAYLVCLGPLRSSQGYSGVLGGNAKEMSYF